MQQERGRYNNGLIFFILLIVLSVAGFGQDLKLAENKIDDFFLSLIRQEATATGTKKTLSCSSAAKAKSAKKLPNDNAAEQKYECIVYTKDAKALRNKNITINSELPGFVTAVVTLKQVAEMSMMPEVSFIEAPKINAPH